MSQHDFNIANQSFPATRTDLNNALAALASTSSGDAEPGTTYANQLWYETDTNTLKIRNEANNGWVDVITLDASMTAAASELNQLDAITRGSILYGNASGETARLAAGGASTVLTSDGTDIAWQASGSSNPYTALSTAATGYITLVGGLIVQWGGIGSVNAQSFSTTSFAITFPNACLSVTLSTTATGVGGGTSGPYVRRGTISTSQIQVQNCSGGTAGDINYIAIGH